MDAEYPKIEVTGPDQAAEGMPGFFSAPQFAALKRLSSLLMPKTDKAPGALEADAPGFLDFLIGKSPADRQELYRTGLDLLNKHASAKYKMPFGDLDDAQAAAIIDGPVKKSWAYPQPSDPLERFLRTAKIEVRAATLNSREYATAGSQGGGRRQGGVGLYWYALD